MITKTYVSKKGVENLAVRGTFAYMEGVHLYGGGPAFAVIFDFESWNQRD